MYDKTIASCQWLPYSNPWLRYLPYMVVTITYNIQVSKLHKKNWVQKTKWMYPLLLTIYRTSPCMNGWSRIIRTWYLASDRLEKVLFLRIIYSNFRALVLWWKNTSVSEFLAKNFLQEGTIYSGPSWPELTRDILCSPVSFRNKRRYWNFHFILYLFKKCQGLTVACDYGTPWTFLLTFSFPLFFPYLKGSWVTNNGHYK